MKDGRRATWKGKPSGERKVRRGELVVTICLVVLMTVGSIHVLLQQRETTMSLLATDSSLSRPNEKKMTSPIPKTDRGYVVHRSNNRTRDSNGVNLVEGKLRTNRTTAKNETGRGARCSCLNARANGTCCQRAVLRAHKFGHMLTQKLFKPFASTTGILRLPIRPDAFPSDPLLDYRHVVMTRNFFETFVSGYLYHKSGKECWLTFNGWRRPRSWGERNVDWRKFVRMSGFDLGPYPPRNNRSICRYLADESEEDGMKVYIAVALSRWYSGLNPYLNVSLKRERQLRDEPKRTLFVCLEDASDAESEESTFYRIMNWLYPRGHRYKYPKKATSKDTSHGGHATTTDREVRFRLLQLVRRYDRELFNNSVGKTDAYFDCNGTIR
jgi:hypothetical protein